MGKAFHQSMSGTRLKLGIAAATQGTVHVAAEASAFLHVITCLTVCSGSQRNMYRPRHRPLHDEPRLHLAILLHNVQGHCAHLPAGLRVPVGH